MEGDGVLKYVAVILLLLEGHMVHGCTSIFDCSDFSKGFCCNGGYCCSFEEHTANAENDFKIGVATIVGIAIGGMVLIAACAVGCALYRRHPSVNRGTVLRPYATPQPVAVHSYPGQQPRSHVAAAGPTIAQPANASQPYGSYDNSMQHMPPAATVPSTTGPHIDPPPPYQNDMCP